MPSKNIKSLNVLDRFVKYDNINSIINDKLKNAENKCLYPVKNGLYKLNDVILLYKQIGIESKYGSVFLSQIKDKKNIYKFATKIQLLTDDSNGELKFLEKLTKIAIRTKNINLPLMYNNLECSYFNKEDEYLPNNLKKEKYIHAYFSTFVELANGDLGTYLKDNIKKITLKQFNNAISQCFVGILTCHKNYIIHNDTHIYNFLYHIINKQQPSCFKYVYYDLTFYIENLGLNWVIWDLGYGEEVSFFKNNHYMDDYKTFLKSFIDEDEIELSDTLYEYLNDIYINVNLFRTDYDMIKYLLQKNILFSNNQIGDVITTIIL